MLRVQLLGRLEVEAAGRTVAAPASRRAWSLLAWLALHPGEHARSAVAARFWPDVLEVSARASLRSAIWALRRALGRAGEEALVAGRELVALRCETDVARFERHLAAGRLADAAALCRGPLLADLDDDWVLEARDEHAVRLGAVLAALTDGAAAPAEAVDWARRRVAVCPLDEAAVRELMCRLEATGDVAGALTVYRRLGERLRTSLDLGVSPETRALCDRLRAARSEPSEEEWAAAGRAPGRPATAASTAAPRARG